LHLSLAAVALLPVFTPPEISGQGVALTVSPASLNFSNIPGNAPANNSSAVDAYGNIFYTSNGNAPGVYEKRADGEIIVIAPAEFSSYYGELAIDCQTPPNIYVIVAHLYTFSILKFTPGLPTPTTLVKDDPNLQYATRLAINCDNNLVYATDTKGQVINSYDLNTGAKQIVASVPGIIDFGFAYSMLGFTTLTKSPNGTFNIVNFSPDGSQSETVATGLNNVQTFLPVGQSSSGFQIVLNPSTVMTLFATNSSLRDITHVAALPTTAGLAGFRIADNESPLPVDRIYHYNAFNGNIGRPVSLGPPAAGPPYKSSSIITLPPFIVRFTDSDPYDGLAYLLPFQITGPPAYLTAYAGLNAKLSVGAAPQAAGQPLYYQWSWNGAAIPGATNATLTISNAQPANAGVYVVRVSLTAGDTNSDTLLSDGGLKVLSPYTYSAVYQGLFEGIAAGDFGTNHGAFMADTLLSRIVFLNTNNSLSAIAGSIGGYGYADGTNGAARFAAPQGIAIDAATNLYVADTGNHLIRMIQPSSNSWVVTTIAGFYHTNSSGLPLGGYADGTGTNAMFSHPRCVAVDLAGNVYVGDGDFNNVVRKLTPTSTNWMASTLAGRVGWIGYENGQGTNAIFNGIYGLAVDALGNVFVADKTNDVIRQVTTNGTVTTIAGLWGNAGSPPGVDGEGAVARFSGPDGIALDCAGNLWVADSGDGSIRELLPQPDTNWLVTTAGVGPFIQPRGVATDCSGILYVADPGLYAKGSNSVLVGLPGASPPSITTPPVPQTAVAGGSANLSVTVSNSSPVAYQWLFNGVALASETNSTISVSGLARANEGWYQVVITGDNGALVSSPVQVRVLVPPVLQPPMPLGTHGEYTLLFSDADGGLPDDLTRLAVQWRTNLPFGADTNWQILSSSAYLTNGLVGVDDTNPTSTPRFYRVLKH
jgi:sugar lactone lactonase YvrE